MFIENFKTAVLKLKRVLPLLMQYRIAPHPLNYALWYAYVSDMDKNLTRDLDMVLEEHGTCPDLIVESLYRKHILKESPNLKGFDDGLLSLTNRLCGQVNEARQRNAQFLEELNRTVNRAGRINNLIQLREVITEQANLASQNHEEFKVQLEDAQEELFHLRQLMNDLSELEAIDATTGLYNRTAFEQDVTMAVRKDPSVKFSLALIAIDDFLEYSAQCGRRLGDKLLIQVANTIREHREGDCTIYRMSSGLIGVMMPNRNALQAKEFAETIRYEIGRKVVRNRKTGETVASISASVGVAQYGRGEAVESFVHKAETALYKASSSGISCVKIAS